MAHRTRRLLVGAVVCGFAWTGGAAASSAEERGIDPNQGESLVEVILPSMAAATRLQLDLCARLSVASDAAGCVRGTKAQNLLGSGTGEYVTLIRGCERSRGSCYRWLGKSIAVLTDGGFGREGCPKLPAATARRRCAAGASRIEETLVTFS